MSRWWRRRSSSSSDGVGHKFRHSLKARLVLLFMLLALGTTAVFLLGMQRLLHNGWQAYAQPLVRDTVDRLTAEIGSPPDPDRARALAQRLPIVVRIDGPHVQLDTAPNRSRHGPLNWRQDEHESAQADNPDDSRSWGLTRTTADGHRIHFSLAAPPDAMGPRRFGWITLAALLVLTALAYLGAWRLLRPLRTITTGVEAFGRGDFSQPIALQRRDELGALAERINGMAASLHGMLDAKRALLLAMSHELRSPLTRARVNAELLDDGAERSALLRDLGEMRDLITALLESERLAQGHAALQAEAVDLAALAREAVAADDEAAAQALAVELQLDEDLGPVQVDPTRVRLLLRNLLANAHRHAADAPQPPLLYLRREADGRVALGLRDHGPGVPEAVLPRLAEAFYRPDLARTRGSGGVGLGLHLCRLVAQAHGGELRIRSASPGLDVAMVWAAAAGTAS